MSLSTMSLKYYTSLKWDSFTYTDTWKYLMLCTHAKGWLTVLPHMQQNCSKRCSKTINCIESQFLSYLAYKVNLQGPSTSLQFVHWKVKYSLLYSMQCVTKKYWRNVVRQSCQNAYAIIYIYIPTYIHTYIYIFTSSIELLDSGELLNFLLIHMNLCRVIKKDICIIMAY